jgi:primosomal protein N'
MSTGTKVFLGIFIFLIISAISIVGYVVSAKFTAEKHEKGIIYSSKNMQNVHSSVRKIVKTSGLTVKNFGDTKIKAINAKIQQYADKPKMMMMWVKENPQQIDSKVWEKFQDQMEKQYTRFDTEQKMKIARSQAYDTYLSSSLKGFVASEFWSYPTMETKALMEQVIQTEETKDTFETGIDKAVEVF